MKRVIIFLGNNAQFDFFFVVSKCYVSCLSKLICLSFLIKKEIAIEREDQHPIGGIILFNCVYWPPFTGTIYSYNTNSALG